MRLMNLRLVAFTMMFVLIPCLAEEENKMTALNEDLLSEKEHVRITAAEALASLRGNVTERLIRNLTKTLEEEPDMSYQGPIHLTLQSIGEWRLEEAIPTLIKFVDIKLEKTTFPVGARRLQRAYYPVADALVKIGGRSVIDVVLNHMEKPEDENKLRFYAWVLRESLGVDLAVVAVKIRKERHLDEDTQESLNKVIDILRESGPILPVVRH